MLDRDRGKQANHPMIERFAARCKSTACQLDNVNYIRDETQATSKAHRPSIKAGQAKIFEMLPVDPAFRTPAALFIVHANGR